MPKLTAIKRNHSDEEKEESNKKPRVESDNESDDESDNGSSDSQLVGTAKHYCNQITKFIWSLDRNCGKLITPKIISKCELEINCKYLKYGCTNVAPYDKQIEHLKNCDYGQITCPCCYKKHMSEKFFFDHLTKCPKKDDFTIMIPDTKKYSSYSHNSFVKSSAYIIISKLDKYFDIIKYGHSGDGLEVEAYNVNKYNANICLKMHHSTGSIHHINIISHLIQNLEPGTMKNKYIIGENNLSKYDKISIHYT